MRRRARRWVVAAAVVAAGCAGASASALGLAGVSAPAVPSAPTLEPPAQLPPPPPVPSVPVPQSPAAPSVPSAPSIHAPAGPSAPPVPRAPSAPAAPGVSAGGSSTAGGGSPSGAGSASPGGSATAAGGGRAPGRSAARRGAGAHSHAAPSRRRRFERRLRDRVRRERGCLSALDPTTRELLGLRAGLHGDPVSRGRAARELGLTRERAARLERSGLRDLHAACGSGASRAGAPEPGGGSVSARVALLAGEAPALQPARYLPLASAPDLKPATDMGGRRGSGAVKDATASAGSPAGSRARSAPLPIETGSVGAGDGSTTVGLWVAAAAMLAALAAVAIVRRVRGGGGVDDPYLAPLVAAAPPPELPQSEAPRPPEPASRAPKPPPAVTTVRMRPRDPRRIARGLKRRGR